MFPAIAISKGVKRTCYKLFTITPSQIGHRLSVWKISVTVEIYPNFSKIENSAPARIPSLAWQHHDFQDPLCVFEPLETDFYVENTFEWQLARGVSKWSKCTISWKTFFFYLSPDLLGMGMGPNRGPWDPFGSPKLPAAISDWGSCHGDTINTCNFIHLTCHYSNPLEVVYIQ